MKILFFTKYTRKGASSRLRSFQYIPLYSKQGHTCIVQSLFDDNYLDRIYNKRSTHCIAIIAYLKRFVSLYKVFSCDVVIVEKELFPYLPPFVEWIFAQIKVKYFVDYDDAIFHNYDLSSNGIIRFFLKNKIDRVMHYAYYVIAGNEYLAERARRAGANRISIIPTVVDIKKYSLKEINNRNPVVIGWIGTPFTSKYLASIKEVLTSISRNYAIKLKLIGLKEGIGLNEIEELCDWSETTEVDLIKSFDIGIMPLRDSEWERGKCGYKLIQYMSCGIPVVGSPVGVNQEIISEGFNGFKPSNVEEWKKALLQLILSPELRYKMGRMGRKLVEEKYSLTTGYAMWSDRLTN